MDASNTLNPGELKRLRQWVGRTVEARDTVTAGPAQGLAATLGVEGRNFASGTPLPALWHWLYCLLRPIRSDLGPDGHARNGYGLPPVPFPRRMWAGGSLRFHAPLSVGAQIARRSTLRSVEHKQGRSGELLFFTVDHQIFDEYQLLIDERQDIVYRPAGMAAVSARTPVATVEPASDGMVCRQQFIPTEADLFRYSALTFNSHRIHYDLPYAREQEGYPGLVVHGPLLATLLAGVAERALGAPLGTFEFSAIAPAFHGQALDLRSDGPHQGVPLGLSARNAHGVDSMQATAQAVFMPGGFP